MYSLIIAEDEELELQVLTRFVQNNPDFCLAGTASSGKEALALGLRLCPDLAIMDIKMPGLSGIEAAGLLRRSLPDLEIIFISAYGDKEFLDQAKGLGEVQYLFKPTRQEELLAAMAKAKKALTSRSTRSEVPATQPHRIIQQVKSFLALNYHREVMLAEVAQEVFLSPSYLSRLFKKTTGESLTGYLTGVRLNKAVRLLTETDKPVEEIAKQTGFATPNYFCAVFKARYHLTPLAYRNLHKTGSLRNRLIPLPNSED
ncbi:MAG: helix-turn-helix domain-containing protein [Bacillota bacterium]